MANQKIITIVGGTGFLGRYVVWELAKAGYTLRVISRNPDAALPVENRRRHRPDRADGR